MKKQNHQTALIIGKDELYAQAVKKLMAQAPYDLVYFYEPSHTQPGSIKNSTLVKVVEGFKASSSNNTQFSIARNLKSAVAASNTIVALSPAAHKLVMDSWLQPGTQVVSAWGSYDEVKTKAPGKAKPSPVVKQQKVKANYA